MDWPLVLTRSGEKDVERAVGILSSYLLGQLKELTSVQTVKRRIIQKIAAGNRILSLYLPYPLCWEYRYWCQMCRTGKQL
jgi:hypothetical protein